MAIMRTETWRVECKHRDAVAQLEPTQEQYHWLSENHRKCQYLRRVYQLKCQNI